jgi:SNF2 family DNA or RNA helicase
VKGKGFKLIIADEIQRIRTPSSRRSRSLRQLSASVPFRIGLSGTPLTNTVNDLLPLGSFLVPSDWKPRATDKDLNDIYPVDPYGSITEHLGSMMVRRRMKDVGAKLPQRNDHRLHIDLTPEQIKAISDLENEAETAKQNKEFDGNQGRMHAFAKLMRMRQIVNNPNILGIKGGNPKVVAALDLAESFISAGRKGVMFCADRTTFVELGEGLKQRGIGYVQIWGSTLPQDRINNEKKFHKDPEIKVVICTIQAGSESWSASPTATWLISTSYMYAPSMLSQMEARVYRMNSDPNGPEIEITYIHASATFPTLDDRMLEIIDIKREIFANIIDRKSHKDETKMHYSMEDITYLLTGKGDSSIDRRNKVKKNKKIIENIVLDEVDLKLDIEE